MIKSQRQELLKAQKLAGQYRRCLHWQAPERCSGQAISAHTLSRATILEPLAKNGQVLRFTSDRIYWDSAPFPISSSINFDTYQEYMLRSVGNYGARPEGINTASTFTGFCNQHDHIFDTIDRSPLDTTRNACLLHAYRSIVADLWVGTPADRNLAAVRAYSDRTEWIDRQREQLTGNLHAMASVKRHYDYVMRTGDSGRFRAVTWSIPANIGFTCAGTIAAPFGLHGVFAPLEDVPQDVLRSLALHILPSGVSTSIIISWLDHEDEGGKLLNRLKSILPEKVADVAFLCACNMIDNKFFSYKLWDGFTPWEREAITTLSLRPLQYDSFLADVWNHTWFNCQAELSTVHAT